MTSRNPKVELFVDASPEEREAALENLRRFLRVVVRIYECIQSDPEVYRTFKTLTEEIRRHRIDAERSNITQNNIHSEA